MQAQEQGKEPNTSREQQKKRSHFFWLRTVGFVIAILAIIIIGIFFIRTPTNSPLSNILGGIFIIVAVLLALFQLIPIIFPSIPTPTIVQHIHLPTPAPVAKVNYTEAQSSHGQKSTAHVISSSTGSVFLFNTSPLPDVDEFYGRARERVALIGNTVNGRSTSLVGPRRIGKTWLIDYLKLIAPAQLGLGFQLASLDGTQPSGKSVSEFTAKALDAFGVPLATRQTNLELDMLERLVKDLRAKHVIPVLCIDEFEGFFNQQAFDCDFFAGLRYIAQNGLVLVIASKHPLIDLIGDRCKTSGFFNIFEQHTLKPFTKLEAEEFARAKSEQAGFTGKECSALLTYGQEGQQGWPPLRLQLAGKMLLTDKNLAVAGKSDYYRPDDQAYWREFEQRLEETYRGVVR
jgi:hypothetical protein